MSHSIGVVIFEDDSRLYCVHNGTLGITYRPLFDTVDEAWAWRISGKKPRTDPTIDPSEVTPVTVICDQYFEDTPSEDLFSFESTASKAAKWIVGRAASPGSIIGESTWV